jgi:hypothetical protein
MSVEIIAEGRVPYQEPDAFGGTPQERSEAISRCLSYTGVFELLAHRDTVIHHIEVCSYPNWIVNAQMRFAKREGDLLVLSTKPMTFQGVKRSAQLVWGARRPRLNPTDSPTDYSSTSISASAGPNRLAASIA